MDQDKNMMGILFQTVSRSRTRALQSELARQGLGDVGNPLILFLLKERGQDGGVAAQRELSDALHVSPATVAVSLKSLERGGYVEKLPDQTDQRRKGVVLTVKGEQAVRRSFQAMQMVDQEMFHGFTDQEQEWIGAYFARMVHNLRGEFPPKMKFQFGKEDGPC